MAPPVFILSGSRWDRTISAAEMQAIQDQPSQYSATLWDNIADWFCGTRKADALEKLALFCDTSASFNTRVNALFDLQKLAAPPYQTQFQTTLNGRGLFLALPDNAGGFLEPETNQDWQDLLAIVPPYTRNDHNSEPSNSPDSAETQAALLALTAMAGPEYEEDILQRQSQPQREPLSGARMDYVRISHAQLNSAQPYSGQSSDTDIDDRASRHSVQDGVANSNSEFTGRARSNAFHWAWHDISDNISFPPPEHNEVPSLLKVPGFTYALLLKDPDAASASEQPTASMGEQNGGSATPVQPSQSNQPAPRCPISLEPFTREDIVCLVHDHINPNKATLYDSTALQGWINTVHASNVRAQERFSGFPDYPRPLLSPMTKQPLSADCFVHNDDLTHYQLTAEGHMELKEGLTRQGGHVVKQQSA